MSAIIVEDLFAKVNCTYCQEEIAGVRIQCCVCPDFDICLQCFASGAEIGPHKSDHSYKFVDHCNVSIFGGRGNWTAREELLLLDAVELFGFGNWDKISEHVESRTSEEVKEEYIARYLEGNIGKATWAELADHKQDLTDHVREDNGPLSPLVTSRLPPLDATPEEARLLGYKVHRDDYEREYDTAAEQLVSSLQLDTFEDSNIEIALKLLVVDIYSRRLKERARRKRIVRDYQLVAKFFANQRNQTQTKRPLSKEQRDLRENMKIFSQFLTSGEHERLIASIEREKELRHRLSELLRYRSVGLTSQEEIIHYEQHEAYHRQQAMKQNKSGSSGLPISILEESPSKNGRSEDVLNSTEKKSMLLLEEEPENIKFKCNCNNLNNSSVTADAFAYRTLLSQHEKQLCTNLNILPINYINLKSIIIQDNLSSPKKYRKSKNDLNSQENSIEDAVVQYISTSGWLPES